MNHLIQSSITYLRLDGSVEPERRFEIVKAFNSDPTIDVLLLTTHGIVNAFKICFFFPYSAVAMFTCISAIYSWWAWFKSDFGRHTDFHGA